MATVAYDVNNFAINRILRGVMVDRSVHDKILWSIDQITNPSLSITTEKDEVVDAMGAKITEFERAKTAEFTAENALFDLGLFAAQAGTEKQIASDTTTILTPAFQEFTIASSQTEITLAHTPAAQISTIYLVDNGSTISTINKFTNGSSATETEFVHAEDSSKITIPTGLAAGSTLFVTYEYNATKAVAVDVDAKNFPKVGRFIMEVLGSDVCNPDVLIHAYVVYPSAKLQADVDISFASDGTHNFTIQGMNDYCSQNQRLLSVIIPDEE